MHKLTVIFDLDGTLIESEQVWEAVRKSYALSHGGRWHPDAQSAMIGLRTTEWSQYMHDALLVKLPPEQIATDVVEQVANELKNAPVIPGAQSALERLSKEFCLGLATSAALPVAQSVLASTGWSKLFEAVVSADQVPRGKPAPDVYLRALELLQADAGKTAAVEDSAAGIRSAHAARLAVVAIPNRAFPPGPDALALAARVIPNLDALDAGLIRQVLNEPA